MLLYGKSAAAENRSGCRSKEKRGRKFHPFRNTRTRRPLSRNVRTQHDSQSKSPNTAQSSCQKAPTQRPSAKSAMRPSPAKVRTPRSPRPKKCGGSPFFDKKQTPPRNVSANSIKETPKPQICVVPTPESADTTQPRRKARVQHYTDRKARRDALVGKKAARRARVSAVFRQNWDAETDVTVIHHLCRIRPEKPRSVRRTDRKPCGCTKPCFRGRSAAPVCAAASLRSRFSRRIALPAGRLFPQDERCAKGARPAAFSGGAGSFCAMPCVRTDRPVLLSRRRGGRGRARARA